MVSCSKHFGSDRETASNVTKMSHGYNTHIRPIMQAACVQCHSVSSKTAGLALDSLSQNDYLAGDLSARWNKVLSRIQDGTMPPPPGRITSEQKQIISVWIQQGMP